MTPLALVPRDSAPVRDHSKLRKHCDQRLQDLEEARRPVFEFVKTVAEELMPSRMPYLLDPHSQQHAGQQNAHIVDSVGHQSLATAAAGVGTGTMPASSPWFELLVRNEWGDDDETKQFLQDLAERARTTINQSNAHQVLPAFREEWLAFGTAAALLVEDDEDVIRLDVMSFGEFFIAENHRGRVDTLYRKMTMTVGQLAEEFGEDVLSASSKHQYELGHYDTVVPCIHAIEPDRDRENPSMPFRSVYYELGASSDLILALRWFKRFPCLVSRYGKLPGTAYGLGRGMDALPHLVRLRKMIYRYGNAMAEKCDPPTQHPSHLQQHEVRALPGGKTAVMGAQKIENLRQINLDLREMDAAIEKTRQDVRDTIGSTVVASLRAITHQMTAREVDTRTQQDLMEFLPAIHRQHEEVQSPLVEMTIDALDAQGQMPQRPASLPPFAAADIEFTSPFARKARQGEVDAIVRTYSVASEIAKVRKDVVDVLNPEWAIRRIAQIEGAPVQALLGAEQVRQQRQAQQQAQLAEAKADAAQRGVDLARGMAEAERAGAA